MKARIKKYEQHDGIHHMPDGTPNGSNWKDMWDVSVSFDREAKADEFKRMVDDISDAALGDTRRWRIERKNGDILRDVRFAHFSGENGYFLPDRCAIGNIEIGHMVRVDGNAIFRCA